MKKKRFLAFAGLIALTPLSGVFAQHAGQPSKTTGQSTYNEIIQAPANENAFKYVSVAQDIQWFDAQGSATQDAHTLLRYLQDAPSHGLNPDAYKTSDIAILINSHVPAANRSSAEQMLTQAMVAYAQDMTGPRINPSAVRSSAEYWRKPLTKSEVLVKYAATGSMDAMLKSIEPKNPLYAALRTELRSLTQRPPSATNDNKIAQLMLNMERLRWDQDRPARYIEVNIADQTLNAVENGKTAQSTHIIVGKPQLQTREFTTPITGVKFNPTWHVTAGVMRRLKLPELRKDPYSLQKKNIHIFYDGELIDPGTVDWKNISTKELAHIKMQQDPGADNALGQIRVMMEDRYLQYLHYTNQPELFENDQRTFSSGCMRMEEPDKIVCFILSITPERVEELKNGGSDVSMKASHSLSFYSVYHTTTVGPDGKIQYHKDIYGRDKKLLEALEKDNALPHRVPTTPTGPAKLSYLRQEKRGNSRQDQKPPLG
ncbi:MAG: L,D-transpeptidase family protein [Proteobacteria bacterium]|nr:L,D-transpeptidase family protein [Pseudomonadota bacterium]